MFTRKELYSAFELCRKGKHPSFNQMRFETKLGLNIETLLNELNLGEYKVSPYSSFVTLKPKPREIFAANFRDRLVHHVIVSRLTPLWERRFYDGSFACRKGKGTLNAIKYVVKKHYGLSQGGKKEVFFLQMDLAAFFVTIDRQILFNLLNSEIDDPLFLNLIEKTILHDATVSAWVKSHNEYLKLIPPHKSLFNRKRGQGIPIGNLTSQFGANVYLTGWDHFISRNLRPGAYLRYMDDILLLDTDPSKLLSCIEPIINWVKNKRLQDINPDKTIWGSFRNQSMDYLGHKFCEKNGELFKLAPLIVATLLLF